MLQIGIHLVNKKWKAIQYIDIQIGIPETIHLVNKNIPEPNFAFFGYMTSDNWFLLKNARCFHHVHAFLWTQKKAKGYTHDTLVVFKQTKNIQRIGRCIQSFLFVSKGVTKTLHSIIMHQPLNSFGRMNNFEHG